jgi:hypothetical protein
MNETVILVLAGARVSCSACFFSAVFGGRCAGAFRRNGRRFVSWKPPAANEHHALAGFYAVSGGHWDRLLACLLGFVIARLL